MNDVLIWGALCLAAYLTGSIPFGYLAGKLIHQKDIRQGGSGNIGATNALRQYGVMTGVLVLLLDLTKGFLVAWLLCNVLPGVLLKFDPAVPLNPLLQYLPALFVIIGHMYPVFLGFKGGKGVATAAGVYLFIAPLLLAVVLVIFIILTYITRYVSVGSIGAAISLFVAHMLWNMVYLKVPEFPWITFIVGVLIIYKHNANILRLLEKKENKLSFGGRGKI
jgi:acyl phosphate:glycerol-3-phosphate acyltransferase